MRTPDIIVQFAITAPIDAAITPNATITGPIAAAIKAITPTNALTGCGAFDNH